ncbi:hypothetical protein [Streptomyces sp. NPDC002580]|uniref:hypothetical protein n=1 Tax=Streptomyces sp. NPDC002580 TaxID=3364653 RepID=UPI0036A195DA
MTTAPTTADAASTTIIADSPQLALTRRAARAEAAGPGSDLQILDRAPGESTR